MMNCYMSCLRTAPAVRILEASGEQGAKTYAVYLTVPGSDGQMILGGLSAEHLAGLRDRFDIAVDAALDIMDAVPAD
jgi:hypothetical protein